MLGIIFTGGESPPSHVIKRLIKEETDNPLLIAADSGLAAAESADFKPDWVIGDMDSLDDTSRLAAYSPERIIRYEHDKDNTDTELAFSHAVKQGCNDIWIIGGGGGRLDHLFGIRSLFERDIFPRRWITDNADIHCIEAGSKICLSVESGVIVSVFPLGAGPWKAKSSGLKWPLEGLPWDRGFFGLSNVAEDGKFSIEAEKGRFMVILPF